MLGVFSINPFHFTLKVGNQIPQLLNLPVTSHQGKRARKNKKENDLPPAKNNKIKLHFSLIPFLTVPSCCSHRKSCCSKTIMNLKTSHASEICFQNYYNILYSTNKAPLIPLSTCFLLYFSGAVLCAQQSIEIFCINK